MTESYICSWSFFRHFDTAAQATDSFPQSFKLEVPGPGRHILHGMSHAFEIGQCRFKLTLIRCLSSRFSCACFRFRSRSRKSVASLGTDTFCQ